MSDYNNGTLPDPCLRLDYGFGEQWASVELGDGTGYVRLADYEKAVAENAGIKQRLERAEQLLGKREYDIKKLHELVSQLQTDLESEFDDAEQMEVKEEMYKAENAELRELLSMYMTFARTVARGLSIQSAYPDGMGRKLDEAEMMERAMELGIEWCR